MAMAACPFREPMMVVSVELRYSTSLPHLLMCSARVITIPLGMGVPNILCPDTETESIGLSKLTWRGGWGGN